MSFSGHDIEDAIVMNRASCDRGYGRASIFKSTVAELDRQIKDGLGGRPIDMA